MNEFTKLNELIREANDTFLLNETVETLHKILEATENVYNDPNFLTTSVPQDVTNKLVAGNVKADSKKVSNEAMKLSQMTPAECKRITSSPDAAKAALPNVTKNMDTKQLTEPEILLAQSKSILRSILLFTVLRKALTYAIEGFKMSVSYAKSAMKDEGAKGLFKSLNTTISASGVPWYYLACGFVGMGTACYMILRKRNKKLFKNKGIQESEYLEYLDETFTLDETYTCIQENTTSDSMNSFLNRGFSVMISLGHQIDSSDIKNKAGNVFENFCAMIQQMGTYALAKTKGYTDFE